MVALVKPSSIRIQRIQHVVVVSDQVYTKCVIISMWRIIKNWGRGYLHIEIIHQLVGGLIEIEGEKVTMHLAE